MHERMEGESLKAYHRRLREERDAERLKPKPKVKRATPVKPNWSDWYARHPEA